MSNELSLRVFYNGRMVQTKRLGHEVIKIGKLPSSHICLEDDRVAKMHAVIESSGSDVRVIDLGSAGGTFLNGSRIDNNAQLAHGDALAFGPYRIEVELLNSACVAAAGFVAAGPLAVAPADPVAPVAPADPVASAWTDAGEVERHDGSQVTEVLATYRGTVLDAQHVGQVRNRSRGAPLFLGAAGLLVVAGGALLASEVSRDWEAYAAAKTVALEHASPAPETPGLGLGGVGLGLMLLGLLPMGVGVVRLSDRGVIDYRIGEGHHAEFHTTAADLPGDTFALVRGGAAGNVLNFTSTMSGAVSMGGVSISLAELVASGRAVGNGSEYAYALPPGARCKVEYGDLAFFVNEVPPGKVLASKGEADKPFWAYNAASCAAIGTLLVMTHLIANDAMAMDVDQGESGSRYVGYITQPDIPPDEVVTEEAVADLEQTGGEGERHTGNEGAMGDPSKKAVNKRYTVKGPRTAAPQMARNFEPELQARHAGILGQIAQESGHFLATPMGAAFAVGNDDADLWGNMTGTEGGASFGVMGLGNVGPGRGGGGLGEGVVGMGTIGLMGHGANGRGGSGYGPGGGNGSPGFKTRRPKIPRVRAAKVTLKGGMDKSIIRRIVRNHFREVVHCYNQGLVRDPNLRGRVAVQFSIGPSGKVAASTVASNTTGDTNTARCIAGAVKRWSFPRPPAGGSAFVTYPFVLNPG